MVKSNEIDLKFLISDLRLQRSSPLQFGLNPLLMKFETNPSPAPVEWDGKFAPKTPAGRPTPLNEQGVPILTLGVENGDVRRAIKERQASQTTRRLIMITTVLIPVALGGVSGTLFFDGPIPNAVNCVTSALLAILFTAMAGGCIFSAIMFHLLRFSPVTPTASPLSLASLFLAPLTGFVMLSFKVGEEHEAKDPLVPATIVTAVVTVMAMPIVGYFSRLIGSSEPWGPATVLPAFVGGFIGAFVGGVLVLIVHRIIRVRKVTESKSDK